MMKEQMTYELDWTMYYPDDSRVSAIAVLTGHEIEDILAVCPKTESWRSSSFKEAFHQLGFNTNKRFMAFDPETIYPCLMRYKDSDIKGNYWYCRVYYHGRVYGNGYSVPFDYWIQDNPNCRVTSMLQVWI